MSQPTFKIETRTSILYFHHATVYEQDIAVAMARNVARRAAESEEGYERIEGVRVTKNDEPIYYVTVPRESDL